MFEKLSKWFETEQRDLPWRVDRSPYAVWVSEMMLQQTQVSVVIPYFQRWMSRFPTIDHLANAELDEVIKTWEGLGYYSRARFLHSGAKQIVENFKGIFPNKYEDLKQIKGLGPYTIGAIRSFAFHQRTAAVDGNVIRVLCRLFMIQDDVSKLSTLKKIGILAEEILPEKKSWVVNEALIELGATICTKKPKCHICPMRTNCKAFAAGNPEALPMKSKKTVIEALFRSVAIVQHGNKMLIKRGQKGEIMSDLHEFPYFETTQAGMSGKEFSSMLSDWLGCKLEFKQVMPEVAHSFTRYRVKLMPMMFNCNSHSLPKLDLSYKWVSCDEIHHLAFSSGHRRILQNLDLLAS